MIAWTTVEDAIHAWIVAGSQLDPSVVIWGEQDGPRPAAPYIALNISNIRRIGQDAVEVADHPTPTPGAEILYKVRGVRECLLNVQCFGGGATGSLAPEALLDAVVTARSLPSHRDALNAAGVGVAAFTPVQSIGGVIVDSVFESRAVTDCRFFLSAEVEEPGTYIETVEITDDDRGNMFTVPAP